VLNKRTGIGIGVGATITAIGIYALVASFGLQTVQVDDTFEVGESETYRFNAPLHSQQRVDITGNSFHVNLKSPTGGLQIPDEDYKKELSIEWVHLESGESILEIQNTGDSELHVMGTLEILTDPLQFTYHILVITAGLVIIGFSAGFSVRKPSGF
jgi:hypothetical protein